MLTGKTLVILATPTVTAAEVTVLTNWVNAGGNLIAMRPDKKLARRCSASPTPARPCPTPT